MSDAKQAWWAEEIRRMRHVKSDGNTVLTVKTLKPTGDSRAARHTGELIDVMAETLIPPASERAAAALAAAAAAGRVYEFRPARLTCAFAAEPCGKGVFVTVFAQLCEGEAPPRELRLPPMFWRADGAFQTRRLYGKNRGKKKD